MAYSSPSPKTVSDFDRQQQGYFEKDIGYVDPRHPTAQAFVRPKLDYICSRFTGVQSVLDVGAGNGMCTYYWQERVPTVEGLELSRKLISQSPCKHRLRWGNAYDIPYGDNAFDLVFESNLLHHVNDPVRVLGQMRRVARKYVVCIEPNRNNPPMFAFSLIVPAERNGLKFTGRYVKRLMRRVDLKNIVSYTTGMVTQHRTPPWILPLLKPFDCRLPFGMYSIVTAEK